MEPKHKLTYKMPNQENSSHLNETIQETAASLSDLEPYTYGKNSSNRDRERKKIWSRIILTALSAILIGTTFGLLMLTIFSNGTETPAVNEANHQPTKENQSAGVSAQENQKVELDDLSGYVIQAGVFQSLEQAELTQETLATQGLQSIIWETETDYRVFLAIYQSEQDADLVGEKITDEGIETYVRQWQSSSESIPLSEEEQAWLTEFQSLWEQSSTDFSSEIEQAWDSWLTIDSSEFTEPLRDFHEVADLTLQQLNQEQLPYYLLVLLFEYHQMLNG